MRVTNAAASRKRRKRMVTAAKGYRMRRSKLYRYASDAVDHGRQYAYRDRRVKKRTFRYLWQVRKRRKRMVTAAKGFRMRRSKLYRYASDAVDHGRQYAYRDRRVKKRTFRYLWQVRINAAARAAGITYSRFIEGLKAAKVALDRKILADLAATDAAAFTNLVKIAQDALKAKGVKG